MVLVKVITTLRNNWKKTVFFTVCSAYGAKFADKWRRESLLLREYCHEAAKFGNQKITARERPRKVVVFLNPAAKDGKTKYLLDNYVLPLLHLAGLEVNVVRTEHEGQAKSYMGVLDTNVVDSILVAGGDGTLSEIVTGLLRRGDNLAQKIPIGVLPFGNTNSYASQLFPMTSDLEVERFCKATMALIKNSYQSADVIQVMPEEDNSKPVYILDHLHWGVYTDIVKRKKKYWYMPGSLKLYYCYVKQVLFGSWPPTLSANLLLSDTCSGCRVCTPTAGTESKPLPTNTKKSWTSWLSNKSTVHVNSDRTSARSISQAQTSVAQATQPQSVSLPEVGTCTKTRWQEVKTSQIKVHRDYGTSGQKAEMVLDTLPVLESKLDFLTKPPPEGEKQSVSAIRINPEPGITDPWYIMDSERFEVKPLTLRLLRSQIKVYTSQPS